MDIMVEAPRASQVAGMLHEREIPFSVAIGDVGLMIEKEQGISRSNNERRGSTESGFRSNHSLTKVGAKRKADVAHLERDHWPRKRKKIVRVIPHPAEFVAKCRGNKNRKKFTLTQRLRPRTGKKMDWKNFHRLNAIYNFMDDLVVEYPYLCSVSVIGRSAEGRDIKMLKISNGNRGNSGVWLDGSIHSREWISTAVVTFIADRIVRTFHEQPESVTNKDWYILPVMNPDGYEYTHTHDRMWRKNRARYGECVGVDLNRNFSYGWGEKGEEGSSEDPGNIFFRGPKPFSEPETMAVKKAILDSETTFKVFLSFHSYGEVIIFPWGYTGDPCPDYVEMLEGGTAMAKAIHDTSGHTYKVGSTKDLMYFAAGTSIDWSYAVASIPYSYMVELRGKKHRFLLPKEEIISTATEVLSGVLRLMDFVDRRCKGTGNCVCPK